MQLGCICQKGGDDKKSPIALGIGGLAPGQGFEPR